MNFHAESIVLDSLQGDFELTADNQLVAYGHCFHREKYILLGGTSMGNLAQWVIRPSEGWSKVKKDYIETFNPGNDVTQFTGSDMVNFTRTVGQVIRRGQEIAKEQL